ncbi:MAG: hypothetical protein R2795_12045 [Saprospiraceae bacterium]
MKKSPLTSATTPVGMESGEDFDTSIHQWRQQLPDIGYLGEWR